MATLDTLTLGGPTLDVLMPDGLTPDMTKPLLALRELRAGYGESVVLDGVSVDLPEGGSLAVLGRNGVGKTTLLATIMGCTSVSAGAMLWRGRDLARMAPHRRARLGIGWVAQEREIFPSLTVEENLTVAARPGPCTSCFRAWRSVDATWAPICPAANSRCWRSRGR
jgi:ABC-type sugar transport system ATPase subunit